MSSAESAPALSLVVPVFNEEGNVEPLHAELTQVARSLDRPYEILFVNDGSTDGTAARLQALREADPHLRIIDLDGNFGESAALSAGFAHARGAVVVTLDGDGQNDPADVPRLLERLTPEVDVVSGRRAERKEAFWSRVLPSRVANQLIVYATGVAVYDCGCGLKAYRRELVAGAQLPRGMNRFLPAILGVDPRRVAEVRVNDRRRGSGQSHYGLTRVFIVLRDLLALPLLVRRPPGQVGFSFLGGAEVALVTVMLVVIAGLVGAPAGAPGLLGAGIGALAIVGAGGAVGLNLWRWTRAQRSGVYRVRRMVS
jgi:glycosyltransferase involved in cell wall biosynthesis